jgi:hypothetical protein
MTTLATVVEWSELGEAALAALVAGIGITSIFAVAVLGAARYLDLRRAARTTLASGAAGLTVIAVVVFSASIVVGIVLMAGR